MSTASNLPEKVSQNLYELMTEEEDSRACKDIADAACDAQPRSFVIHVCALTLTRIGDGLADAKLVLPWLLAAVGAPGFLVAWLVPLRESLSLLPQLVVAQLIRETPVRKWYWVAGSVLQGLALLAMAAAAVGLDGKAAGYTIVAMLALFALARGICSIAIKDVQGKTIAKQRRGQVSGWAGSASGLVIVAFGLYTQFAEVPSGNAPFLAGLLACAAALWLVAALVYARLPEYAGATEGGGNAIDAALASLRLAWSDRALRRFLITRTLLISTAVVAPFYVLMASAATDNSVATLGLMVIGSGLASALSSAIWGRLSDRSSRLVLVAAGALAALLALAVSAAQGLGVAGGLAAGWFFAILFVLGVAHAGVRLGRKTYLIDMASADNRAALVAVSNTVIGVMLLATTALGSLVDGAGPAVAVAALGVLSALGALSAWFLDEVQ